MFSTSLIINKIKKEESVDYKKLCKLLKISKKLEKIKLDIALEALERLEIIKRTEDNEFLKITDNNHISARIRCSSKGYCFAVRDNSDEDIYIKESLINHAWNGDRVLVRIIKEGVKRRSPEGIVDCILERENKFLLAKVQILEDQVYGIPIDDRILSKIKLPNSDKKYIYCSEQKNIVKIEIDMFPIAQIEGSGHVIKELKLHENEKVDNEFVLSKNNINLKEIKSNYLIKEPEIKDRLDLSSKNSFMFKGWNLEGYPSLPLFQIEKINEGGLNLWIHSNSIAERLDFNNTLKECFITNLESLPLSNSWSGFLSKDLTKTSEFKVNEINKAISLCITLSKSMEIVDWSFHLTNVRCSIVVENKHLEAISKSKSKSRVTSRLLNPIKDQIEELELLIKISKVFRENQLKNGKLEISKDNNSIDYLEEYYVHKPAEYSNEFLEPLNNNDIQTFISPLLFEADSIWLKHSYELNIKNASYIYSGIDYLNINEIIKQTQLINSNTELDDEGNLTLNKLLDISGEKNKTRILNKYLINILKTTEVKIIDNKNIDLDKYTGVAPWCFPTYDYINLINQYQLFNMLRITYKSKKNKFIFKKDFLKKVNWKIFNIQDLKKSNLFFEEIIIDRFNSNRLKNNSYKSNMINIKKIREAQKLVGNIFEGLITSVQSYGFFVELPELFIEGLVHVSTLNDDWYEYRSRQNLLVGRKSKTAFRVGDLINIKITKVDILKYQIDLEIA